MTPKKRLEDEVVEPLEETEPEERVGGPGPEASRAVQATEAGTYMLDPSMWAISAVDLGGGVVLRHGQAVALSAEQVNLLNAAAITSFGARQDVLISA